MNEEKDSIPYRKASREGGIIPYIYNLFGILYAINALIYVTYEEGQADDLLEIGLSQVKQNQLNQNTVHLHRLIN